MSQMWVTGAANVTTAPPTTLAPTTLAPTTVAPTTLAPTTAAPTTAAPTTAAPTTAAPTTLAPTTLAPTTLAPTTLAPTTASPTTVAPPSVSEVTGYDQYEVDVTLSTANTKSGYVSLISSSPSAYVGAFLFIHECSGQELLLDIGIGSTGSEVELVSNVFYHDAITSRNSGNYIFIPCNIASGTRISWRAQPGASGIDLKFTMLFAKGSTLEGFDVMKDWGVNTGTTQITSVDPGATANTKGSYVEIASDIGSDIGYYLGIASSTLENSAPGTAEWKVDVATGASGSETIVIPDIKFTSHPNADAIFPKFVGMLPMKIDANTRLSVRCECTITDATDRLLGLALYTMHTPA